MIRISKKTDLTPPEIIDKAAGFFGKGGVGLNLVDKGRCCVSFEGGGGHVTVSLVEEEKRRDVVVEAREWEYDAKRFIRDL